MGQKKEPASLTPGCANVTLPRTQLELSNSAVRRAVVSEGFRGLALFSLQTIADTLKASFRASGAASDHASCYTCDGDLPRRCTKLGYER